MFQQGRAQDPYCQLPGCQGQVQDLEHLFCGCSLVAEAWVWLRSKIVELLPGQLGVQTTNIQFNRLQFPTTSMDQECTWLLGSFCHEVKNTVLGMNRKLAAVVLWCGAEALRQSPPPLCYGWGESILLGTPVFLGTKYF